MSFLTAFEIVLMALITYAVTTQIVVPLWRGTPLVPFLSKEQILRRELSKADEEVIEAELQKRIRETKRTAAEYRRSAKRGETDGT